MSLPPPLLRVVEQQATSVPINLQLTALGDELHRRYGESLAAVLFYGSCLRSGDVSDGLADLYVVVDDYRSAYGSSLQALTNWALPPNVFYLELPLAGGRIRSKYAVLSLQDLLAGTSPRWFHSYLWGRFAQPVVLLYARDEQARGQVVQALAQAAVTFLTRCLPRLPGRFSVRELWEQGLALSYGAELRAEKSGRNVHLFESHAEHYRALSQVALPCVPYAVEAEEGRGEYEQYRTRIPSRVRYLSRFTWAIRRLQGKLLSLLRLSKAVFTFQGGIDYLLWKLERHSGVRIEASEKVRRRPLIYGWALFWRLYRRGVFR